MELLPLPAPAAPLAAPTVPALPDAPAKLSLHQPRRRSRLAPPAPDALVRTRSAARAVCVRQNPQRRRRARNTAGATASEVPRRSRAASIRTRRAARRFAARAPMAPPVPAVPTRRPPGARATRTRHAATRVRTARRAHLPRHLDELPPTAEPPVPPLPYRTAWAGRRRIVGRTASERAERTRHSERKQNRGAARAGGDRTNHLDEVSKAQARKQRVTTSAPSGATFAQNSRDGGVTKSTTLAVPAARHLALKFKQLAIQAGVSDARGTTLEPRCRTP